MRKFDTYPEQKKIRALLSALAFAVTVSDEKLKQVPDIYTFAAEQGKLHGIRPGDFDLIKDQTIQQLITKIKP